MSSDPLAISDPIGLLALVPHFFGYHPTAGAVVIEVGRSRGLCISLDRTTEGGGLGLLDAEAAVLALEQEGASAVVVFSYGTITDWTTRGATIVVDRLRAAGIEVVHHVLSSRTHWRHAECSCCPPEGYELPTEEPQAAEAYRAIAGTSPAASRTALGARFTPTSRALSIEAECDRLAQTEAPDHIAAALSWSRILGSSTPVTAVPDHVLARGAIALQDADLRDALLCRLCPGLDEAVGLTQDLRDLSASIFMPWGDREPDARETARILDRLVEVSTNISGHFAGQVLAVLAGTAWSHRQWALGSFAVERALACDPECRLAHLVKQMLDSGINPRP